MITMGSLWMAGGGVKPAFPTVRPMPLAQLCRTGSVHDLHATILHLMGLDHEKLTYRYSGRDYRLTDVHGRTFMTSSPKGVTSSTYLTLDTELKHTSPNPRSS